MLNIKFYSIKEDFCNAYFAKIFWDEKNSFDKGGFVDLIAEEFNVNKKKIKSIKNINKEIREKLFLQNKTDLLFDEYKDLEVFFQPVNKNNIIKLENKSYLYIDLLLKTLSKIFGESNLSETIEISFIKSYKINFLHGFTYKFILNKIFIFIEDKEFSDKDLMPYIKTILHEICHLFLNQNDRFQEIMKKEWENKYRYINSSNFRNGIEEQIVNTLINGNRDYGFIHKYLNIENDKNLEIESLNKNIFRRITYNFLNILTESKKMDKLNEKLSVFIEDLINNGLFNN